MRARPARAAFDSRQAYARIVHAQRLEDTTIHRLVVEAAGGGEDHVADQAEGDVLVRVALAWHAIERRVGQFAGDVVVLGVGLDVLVECVVVMQSDAVAEQVGDGDLLGRAGVAELEAGHVVVHLAVPAQ